MNINFEKKMSNQTRFLFRKNENKNRKGDT
jgi:hypothetical protein